MHYSATGGFLSRLRSGFADCTIPSHARARGPQDVGPAVLRSKRPFAVEHGSSAVARHLSDERPPSPTRPREGATSRRASGSAFSSHRVSGGSAGRTAQWVNGERSGQFIGVQEVRISSPWRRAGRVDDSAGRAGGPGDAGPTPRMDATTRPRAIHSQEEVSRSQAETTPSSTTASIQRACSQTPDASHSIRASTRKGADGRVATPLRRKAACRRSSSGKTRKVAGDDAGALGPAAGRGRHQPRRCMTRSTVRHQSTHAR